MSNEAVKTPAGQAAIGKTIDKIFSLRKKKAELEAAVKDVEGQIALLDAEVPVSDFAQQALGFLGAVSHGTPPIASRWRLAGRAILFC